MEKHEDGRALATRLAQRMQSESASLTSVAKRLGISQNYLSELIAGDKLFSRAGDDVLRATAEYLGFPAVMGFILAGRLRHEDFLEPAIDSELMLEQALGVIAESTIGIEYAAVKEELRSLPRSVQMLLVMLYQAAYRTELIPRKSRWSWISGRSDDLGLSQLLKPE